MKNKFLVQIILIAGLMVLNFSLYHVYGQTPKNKTDKQVAVTYTCPMHSDITQAYPGKCPKCGMTLVVKKDKQKGNMRQANDSTVMKQDKTKMKHDTTTMKKGHMMHDSTSMKHDQMDM